MSSNEGLQHLAIIMDGNGRWASEQHLPRSVGHRRGYEVFCSVLEHVARLGLKEVSFFALSTENLSRPKAEVSFLMQLFLDAVQNDLASLLENKIRVKVVGDISNLSTDVKQAIDRLHDQTLPNDGMQLNLCFAYSGQWHIEHAVSQCLAQKGDIQSFRQLVMEPFMKPIDLLIRSGNVSRVSNFALWQLAYAELMFVKTYWPDVTNADIDTCIGEFHTRKRRFGQVV